MKSASEYHRQTSYDRDAMGGHSLDWANQPDVYKHYPGLETRALPKEVDWPEEKLSQIVCARPFDPPYPLINFEQIAKLFLLTYSLSARMRHLGGDNLYRNVPSAGALYPCELYVAVQEVDGLDAGLYHYSVQTHGLHRLRAGGLLPYIHECMENKEDAFPVLTFFSTTIFFRSSWKYRDRSYRYHLLDTGHLAENIALALKALHLPFKIDYDFDDKKTNALLGIDERHEVCLAICRVWGKERAFKEDCQPISKLQPVLPEASQVARRETAYPAIGEIHLFTSESAKPPDRDPEMAFHLGVEVGPKTEIQKPANWPEEMSYAEALWRRRSKRNFVKKELTKDHLGALLSLLCAEPDGSEAGQQLPFGLGLLVGDVWGLQSGFYLLDRVEESIKMVAPGLFIKEMAHACLDQGWLSSAAIHFLFLTNLDILEKKWGPRGYRYALISAGRLGQRIYLGATAMGLGCCGIGAFYDQEAVKLLGLNQPSRLLYLVATGPVKR